MTATADTPAKAVPPARTGHALARWAFVLPPLAISFAILAVGQDPTPAESPLPYLADTATGIILAVAGALLWTRRPARKVGPLLTLAGSLWYVGSLYQLVPTESLVPYLGFALRGYYDPIIAFVVLAFPGDWVKGRFERRTVAALVALMVARTAWRLVGTPPGFGTGYPPTAPDSPILMVRDIGVVLTVHVWLDLLVGLTLIAVAILALRRLAGLRASARFLTAPALVAGATWAALTGFSSITQFLDVTAGITIVPSSDAWTAVLYAGRVLAPLGILASVTRLHNQSSSVVEVVAGAEGAPRGPDLESALRTALDDPSLSLAYFGPLGWTDSGGSPIDVEHPPPSRAATMIASEGAPGVAIVHDELVLDEPSLVRTLRAVVGLAIDNDRLQADLRAQLGEVRASRARIAEAADAERRRVEHDLHDGAQQRLVGLLVSLRTLRSQLGPDPDAKLVAELEAASAEARAAIGELRELAQGLDPAILREAGLAAALRSLAGRSTVPVALEADVSGPLPARVETTAYFVLSEALANVAKHARARRVTVHVSTTIERLTMTIADDGIGGADTDGHGLRGLADRVAAVDGDLTVTSPVGGGTIIDMVLPCAS